jgi:predicted transcriptional regulator
MEQPRARLMSLAAGIVTAHLQRNEVRTEAVPGLVRAVCQVLAELVGNERSAREMPPAPYDRRRGGASGMLVCRECGTRMKMLKRHLLTVHRLTPDEYRRKWRLSSDEPMVSSDYAALRSTLAKKSGLGRRPASRKR